MIIKENVQEETSIFKNVLNMFRRRKFEGNAGQAVKNSTYQLGQNLIFKFGSLFYTIILARILLPERMGLYSLTLATIILFSSFSDLGISNALIVFGAKCLKKKNFSKAKGYLKQLFLWKLTIVALTSFLLILFSYFISEIYYKKPIFYALLVGAIYLPIVSFVGFTESIFRTEENFKLPFIKEGILQIFRLFLVPSVLLFSLRFAPSDSFLVVLALLFLVVTYSVCLLFLLKNLRSKVSFLKYPATNLSKKEKKALKKFIIPLTTISMAGLFFGYIDTFMLGHYVAANYISFYSAALSLVGGAVGILSFLSISLMPIFAKNSKKGLDNIFKKANLLTWLLSFSAGLVTFLIARLIIQIVYGTPYLPSVPVLKWFSLLIFLMPIIGLYSTFLIAQKKTKELAFLTLGSSFLNILFNLFGIFFGLQIAGEMGAVFGAVGATILSRVIYLLGLFLTIRKIKKN